MFVLDDLYVSNEVLEFLEESQEPVLDNEAARRLRSSGRNLAIASGAPEPQDRIVALSEMQLEQAKEWCGDTMRRGIGLLKDKAAFRRALAPVFPDYVFEELTLAQLDALDPESVAYPVVLKPSTGFFSVGIYPLFDADGWRAALEDIHATSSSWADVYNENVLNDTSFLIESYLDGDEYAVDAYFDSDGRPVVLNVLKHEFADADDVSDRLYFTSKQVIEQQLRPMEAFLASCNNILGLSDFPVHVEVRVDSDGVIQPIEFNPLRFAGLCTTDVSLFAYGFRTYEMYLRRQQPDWPTLLAGKDGVAYTMILLTAPFGGASEGRSFDYDALRGRFRRVLALREADVSRMGTYGFLFTETRDEDWQAEADMMLHSDLSEFLREA